ncbi:plasmid mobilization protein [Clostridium baratii]|uniref:plasmid mobilization protein n=1 Tax=Clostridium baratii TaxID=1561 RepID=UPI0030D1EBE1
MATKVVKDEVIRVRVTKEQKEKLKRIAKEKGKTISEILSVATEYEIKKFEEQVKYSDEINRRFVATEERIQEIKRKLEDRKEKRI